MAILAASHIKTYLGITASTYDTVLDVIAMALNSFAKQYCGRDFESTTYNYGTSGHEDDAIFDGDNTQFLILPHYPIISVTTLRINETAIDESEGIHESGWFIYNRDGGMIGLRGYEFIGGVKNIELVYTAGYSTVPADLKQALVEQGAYMLKEGAKDQLLGFSTKTHADGSITSFVTNALLPRTRMVLDTYRKKAFGAGVVFG